MQRPPDPTFTGRSVLICRPHTLPTQSSTSPCGQPARNGTRLNPRPHRLGRHDETAAVGKLDATDRLSVLIGELDRYRAGAGDRDRIRLLGQQIHAFVNSVCAGAVERQIRRPRGNGKPDCAGNQEKVSAGHLENLKRRVSQPSVANLRTGPAANVSPVTSSVAARPASVGGSATWNRMRSPWRRT